MITAKLSLLLSAAAAAFSVAEGAELTGYLMDRTCAGQYNCPVGDCFAPDGTNPWYTPQDHTGWCLLLPVCENSGYVLMSKDPTDADGKHSVIANLTESSQAAVVEYIRSDVSANGTWGVSFPLVTVVHDDGAVSVESDGGTIVQVADAVIKDPWPVDAYDGSETTQTICADVTAANIDVNNMCFRSDVLVSRSDVKSMFIIESNGCPDHSNMNGGPGTVANSQPWPLAEDDSEVSTNGGCGACGGCGAACGGCGGGGTCEGCGASCGACGGCGACEGCGSCGACSAGCDACGACGGGGGCGGCGACAAGCGSCSATTCGSESCSAGMNRELQDSDGCGACAGSTGSAGCDACASSSGGCAACAGASCSAGCGSCGGCGACAGSTASAGCDASTSSGACAGASCSAGCGSCGGCGACAGSTGSAGCDACASSSGGCGACAGASCSAGCGGCGSCGGCGACGSCGSCGSCGACGAMETSPACVGCGACESCGGCQDTPTRGTHDPMYQHYTMMIPQEPGAPGDATAITGDVVGIMTNGVLLDSHSQTWSYDSCNGHSDMKHQYHYHIPPICFLRLMGVSVPDSDTWWINDNGTEVRPYEEMADQFPQTGASPVVGFARDGYPIYALYDVDGNLQRSAIYNGGLDECNGKEDSTGTYAYYITAEPPFVPTCLRGNVGSIAYATTNIACPKSGIINAIEVTAPSTGGDDTGDGKAGGDDSGDGTTGGDDAGDGTTGGDDAGGDDAGDGATDGTGDDSSAAYAKITLVLAPVAVATLALFM